jgi:hypothetical protein
MGAIPFTGGERRRPAGSVQPMERPVRLGEDDEAVAADAGHVRLDHAERRGSGDGGVDGIAAFLQHGERRHGGERMRCRGHAVFGIDRGATGQIECAHDFSGNP